MPSAAFPAATGAVNGVPWINGAGVTVGGPKMVSLLPDLRRAGERPAAHTSTRFDRAEPEREGGAFGMARDTNGLRVLLVDDEVLIRMTTGTLVEDMGHVVIEAGTGAEALAALERDATVNVVMVDLGLPDMNGRELIERIRALRPDMPVIVATGSIAPQSVPDTVPLQKPYDNAMLRSAFAALPSPEVGGQA